MSTFGVQLPKLIINEYMTKGQMDFKTKFSIESYLGVELQIAF
jgi:hypothetical protein